MKKIFPLCLLFLGCIYYNTFYNAKKYYSEENYNKTIEKCKKILERHPNSDYADDAIFLMGKSHYHLGNYDKAKENIKKGINIFPSSPFVAEGYLFLGKIALEKKNLKESGIFLDNASELNNPDIMMEIFKTKLELYLLTDEPEKTIEEGEKFIKEYRNHADKVYYIIANANKLIGNKEKALKMYKNALKESTPDKPPSEILYSLAELYVEMDSLKEALSVIEKAENNDLCSLLKGQILMKLKDLEEATKSLDPLKKRRDSLGAVAKYNLGEIKESQGDTSAALDLYIKAGEKDDFGEICEKARAKEQIFKNIATLHTYAKETAEKDNTANKDVEPEQNYEKKDSSYIFFRIGELYYWQLKDIEEGIKWYKKVREEFPESQYAPKAILTLLHINLKEDSTFSEEAGVLFSTLIEKYPESKYSEKAKELYESYFQDTTSYRE
jgi:tetratricopeptide (TPR) repeat protein